MVLKQTATKKQLEAFKLWADTVTIEIVFGGSKGGGKSFFGASCIFHDAFVYAQTRYCIARETLSDLRKHTVPTIYEVVAKWGLDASRYLKFNGQDNKFVCYNGSEVFLEECAALPGDPLFERFGSRQYTRIWLEEAGEISEQAKINLSMGAGRWKNDVYGLTRKVLMTANPKKNWLKYNYIDPYRKGTLPKDKAIVFASIYDNTYRQKGMSENLETLTGVARQRLLLGNWDYDDDDTALINSEKIADLYTNRHIEGGNKYITGDIARFGKDKTVLCVWDGLKLIEIITLKGKKVTEVSEYIQFLINKYQIPLSNVLVDEDGIGGGVVDTVGCKGFVNNSQPLITTRIDEYGKMKPDNFTNLKSQCYFMLADYVNTGKMWIVAAIAEEYHEQSSVRDLLNQELENVRQAEVDGDGKKSVLKKDKLKEILGRSPDYSDAIMMRMYFELTPEYEVLVW